SPPEYDEFLEWAELFADGACSSEDLTEIGEDVATYVDDYAPDWWTGIASIIACAVRLPHADPSGIRPATLQVMRYSRSSGKGGPNEERAEFARQAFLLRDLFGPLPFRPVANAPCVGLWKEGAVVCLAEAAYWERSLPEGALDKSRLAVLADALEDAGCT